jgi:HSP20 family protein
MAITELIPWKKNGSDLAVDRQQPEDSLLDLRSQIDRLFDEYLERPFSLSPYFGSETIEGDFAPKLDVSETDKEIILSVELPGMEPEDIQVSLDRNTLLISGKKQEEKEEQDKRFYRVECSYGSFQRSIPLPGEVDEDKIDASYKRGVLKVKMPKTRQAQENRKRISVKKG